MMLGRAGVSTPLFFYFFHKYIYNKYRNKGDHIPHLFFIMCRIAFFPSGMFTYFTRGAIVAMLKNLEKSRGGHGNGFYFLRTDKVRKSAISSVNRLIKKSVWKGGFLFHTRLATHGRRSRRNSHPFRLNDGSVVVHNGVWGEYSSHKHNYHLKSDTDSEVLGNAIMLDNYRSIVGGNAVMIWNKETGKLHILKQSYSELVVCKYKDYFWIQSEEPDEYYIDKCWEIKRGYYEIDPSEIKDLPEEKPAFNYYNYYSRYTGSSYLSNKPMYDEPERHTWYWGK